MPLAYLAALFSVFRDQMGPASKTIFEYEVRALADTPSRLEAHRWAVLIMRLSQRFASDHARRRFLFKADELTTPRRREAR